jgi:uncharacterized membrane protein
MQGIKRRIIQALSYEIILLVIFAPAVALIFHQDLLSSAALGITLSVLALVWNVIFNALFERWEKYKGFVKRQLKQRIYHAVFFELGFMIVTVPVIAWFLNMTLLHTIIVDIGFALCVMVYTFIFQWAFDSIFGEPAMLHS